MEDVFLQNLASTVVYVTCVGWSDPRAAAYRVVHKRQWMIPMQMIYPSFLGLSTKNWLFVIYLQQLQPERTVRTVRTAHTSCRGYKMDHFNIVSLSAVLNHKIPGLAACSSKWQMILCRLHWQLHRIRFLSLRSYVTLHCPSTYILTSV